MKTDILDSGVTIKNLSLERAKPRDDREESSTEEARFASRLEGLLKERPPERAVPPKPAPKEPPGTSPFVMGVRDLVRLIEDALDRQSSRCAKPREMSCASAAAAYEARRSP